MPVPAKTSWSSVRQGLVVLSGLVGFVFGFISQHVATGGSPGSRAFAASAAFEVRTLVFGAGTAYAALVLLPHVGWFRELRGRFSDLGGQRGALVLAGCWSASMAAPVIIANAYLRVLRSPLDYHLQRAFALLAINLVVALPAVLSFGLVRQAAEQLPMTTEAIAEYHYLRNRLRGLLATLGGLVTMDILEQGARINSLKALPGKTQAPDGLILVFASFLVAGLALLYLPAFSSLQKAGRAFLAALLPMPPVWDEGFLVACEKRDRLRVMLGLDESAKANLERGVLILTPLIAAAVTTFVKV